MIVLDPPAYNEIDLTASTDCRKLRGELACPEVGHRKSEWCAPCLARFVRNHLICRITLEEQEGSQ